ncbi:class I SAM-dependent methyltransferase [candidate division WOR-3 bacterium]|nr:class I SAM-dependent methyltransferase [candidate division WOR-3 bacterium]
MKDHNLRQCWDENAEAWTILSRKGYDIYRDHINTPAFLKMLGDVKGLKGLDLGCGEGYNTRKIAEKGAIMIGVDISEKFISSARQKENEHPLYISYGLGSGLNLPFKDETFDFCVATMSLMDMPNHDKAIGEAYRALKKKGFFQFSISHPCFATPKWEWLYDEKGERTALACGDYFKKLNGEIDEWIFGSAPQELKDKFNKFKVPRFTRTLSSWLNILIKNGFILEEFDEPYPDEETVKKFPGLADARIIAYFLICRCRKG